MVNPAPTMQVSMWDYNSDLSATHALFSTYGVLYWHTITLQPVLRVGQNLKFLFVFVLFLSNTMLPGSLFILLLPSALFVDDPLEYYSKESVLIW